MNPYLIAAFVVVCLLVPLAILAYGVKKRFMMYWLPSHFAPKRSLECSIKVKSRVKGKDKGKQDDLHVFIAVCDHYEPEQGKDPAELAIQRVDRWCAEYPRLFGDIQDSRGRVPQHTFFYPEDEYRPEYLDRLKELVDGGYGDVDVHLHHDGDTASILTDKLSAFRDTLYNRHGLLRRDPLTGDIAYGFIHGNWALCNSRPDGRWCGVDQELTVLKDTGCYADFTMPSAPDPTQTSIINSIYYAKDIPGQRKSHDAGILAKVGG